VTLGPNLSLAEVLAEARLKLGLTEKYNFFVTQGEVVIEEVSEI